MILIKTKPYDLPSYDAIEEFEANFPNSIINKSEVKTKIQRRIIQKIIELYPNIFSLKLSEKYQDVFTILMSPPDIYKLIPLTLFSKRKHIYIYDLWKPEYQYFEKCLRSLNITNVFFSSRQTQQYFNKKCYDLQTKFYWLPEAVSSEIYQFLDYKDKSIDLLSFGRKYDLYHDSILEYAQNNNINYIYQKDKIVFDNKTDFTQGLANSKISLCFPASVTSNKVGNISKITMRYFQSMASKCLILGKAPDDIKYLFDYNPVIEIDEKNPCEQLQEILYNYKNYIPLIERNYQEVISKHLYKNRVDKILDIIQNQKD